MPTHDGVAKVTDTLARELARSGHEVTVFTVRRPGTPSRERRSDGVRVRRYLSLPAPRYPQYRIALLPWTAAQGLAGRFDVAHIHTPGFVGLAGWLGARRARLPSVGTYHTNLTDMLRDAGRSAAGRAFFRSWSRFSIDLCRRCDLATAPTAAAVQVLGPGRSAEEAPRVVPNGVDTTVFRPGVADPDWRARLGNPPGPFVTFLGRFTRDKGVLRFLEAIRRLSIPGPFTALVAGEGPQAAAVEDLLGRDPALAARTRLLGPVAEPEKAALLAQSSVFVLPSLSDTSSVALLEAMAAGAASVVTVRGGPGELARRSEAALLVDPEDVGTIAAAIERLLTDERYARELSSCARDWVVRHASAAKMATEFLASYRDAIGYSARRSRPAGQGPSLPQGLR